MQVFGSARAHHGYLFANIRGTSIKLLVHDGFGVWCAAWRLNAGRFGSSAMSDCSQLPASGVCPTRLSDPFNWHNLAFELFKLSLPAGLRTVRKVSAGSSLDSEAVGMRLEHLARCDTLKGSPVPIER